MRAIREGTAPAWAGDGQDSLLETPSTVRTTRVSAVAGTFRKVRPEAIGDRLRVESLALG